MMEIEWIGIVMDQQRGQGTWEKEMVTWQGDCDTREGNNMEHMEQHNNGAEGSVCQSGLLCLQLLFRLPQAHLWQPSCYVGNPGAWEQGTGGSRTSGQPAASCRSDWRYAWTRWPCSETEKQRGLLLFSILTFSSLIETQQSLGKPWSIGTRNWRHPDQWPIRSIIQIRLNILINTPIEFNNWKYFWYY